MATYEDEDRHYAVKSDAEVRAQSQIDTTATEIAMAAKGLHERVEVLTNRLAPVLRPERVDNLTAMPDDRPQFSPLGDQLARSVDTLGTLDRRLVDLLERIDL